LVAGVLLQHQNTPLGILPAGSSNGLATSLGIPENMQHAIAIAFGSHSENMDVIAINGHYCLHLSDAGFNAELIRNYENGAQRGFLGYAKQMLGTIQQFSGPLQFSLTLGENTEQFQAQMVVIGNAEKYGFGGVINPNGDVKDGRLEIVMVKEMGLPQIVKMMAGANEEDYQLNEVQMVQTKHAIIEFNEPAHVQIDGEYIGKERRIKASICENGIQVMMPGTSL